MTKIIYRPEPIIDTNASHRTKRVDRVQKHEAHSRLFEQALQRAETERSAEIKTHDKSVNKQRQIDRNNQVESSVQLRKSIDSTWRQESPVRVQSETPADPVITSKDSSAADRSQIDDQESGSDKLNEATDDPLFSTLLSTAGHNYSAQQQPPGELFRHHPSVSSRSVYSDSQAIVSDEALHGLSLREVPDQQDQQPELPRDLQQGVVGDSDVLKSDTAVNRLAGLSSLYEFVESNNHLSDFREWSFTFEEEGAVSELTLCCKPDGRWHVEVITPIADNSFDSALLDGLQQRLENTGLAVADITLTDSDSRVAPAVTTGNRKKEISG